MDEQRLPPVLSRSVACAPPPPPPPPPPPATQRHCLMLFLRLELQEAQALFDRYATPICPSQAALPRTPSVARTNGTAPDT